jgi:hypothetical protein
MYVSCNALKREKKIVTSFEEWVIFDICEEIVFTKIKVVTFFKEFAFANA